MARSISYSDILTSVPIFDGNQEDLDYFISVCSTFNDILLTENRRSTFLSIVKTKFKGIALTKMQPLGDLNSWQSIEERLLSRFKHPISYENASEAIMNIWQGSNESIKHYGDRMILALHNLNMSVATFIDTREGLEVLYKTNESTAIYKFEKNIYNQNIRDFVIMRNLKTLDAVINYAMEVEQQNMFRKGFQGQGSNAELDSD